MAVARVPVCAEALEVEVELSGRVGAVDEHRHARVARAAADLLDRKPERRRRADVADEEDARAVGHRGQQLVRRSRRRRVDRDVAGACPLADPVPEQLVAAVLVRRGHHLVAGPQVERARDRVHRRCRVRDEHQVRRVGADVLGKPLPRAADRVREAAKEAQRLDRVPLHVSLDPLVLREDGPRTRAERAVVEEDQRRIEQEELAHGVKRRPQTDTQQSLTDAQPDTQEAVGSMAVVIQDPSGSRYGISHVAALAAAAVLGGAVALGGAALTGILDGGTTTRELVASPVASNPPVAFAKGRALSINEIYRRAAPGVVQITSTTLVDVPQDPIFGNPFAPQQQQTQSLGSGFVIDKAGHVVTNYHVIEGASDVQVSFSSGERLEAKVVGTDPATDIGVLKINASSRALTPLLLTPDSDTVRVGDSVVAIGNPFGYTRSATSGIVSALDRPLAAPDERGVISHGIQTDAALNHGNSGGPLLNAAGEVIGVNSQISTGNTGQEGNLGIGFAIPSNTVRQVVADLIAHGHVDHAFLGIGANELTPQLADLFNLPVRRGLLVGQVDEGSAAANAGLRGGTSQVTVAGESWSLGGDIVVRADGVATPTLDKLRDVIASHEPGDKIDLVIYRDKERQTIEVTLGRQPSP